MIREPLLAVYEGNNLIRLNQPPPGLKLEKEQELLVSIVLMPVKVADKTRPTPLAHFRQLVNELRQYESKYGMSSEEFYQKFQSGAIPEGPFDYFDWRTICDGYRYMQERFHFSREQSANV